MEDAMTLDEPISKELLTGLRSLSDDDLGKIITSISEFGWVKSVDLLRELMKRK
jgi:hypothetical protein